MIKLTRKRLFFTFLTMIAIADLAIVFNPGSFIVSLFIFFFLISVPGLLILLLLRVKELGFWIHAALTVALSVAFLMLSGLLINVLGYNLFHIHPLHKEPLLFAYNLMLVLLLIPAYLRNAKYKYKIRFKAPNKLHKYLLIVPPVLTLLSVGGAISLNNNGTNVFTMIALAGMAISMGVLLFFHKTIKEYIFPYTVYFFSLSLLLMLSLRSWYISGWDIQDEYKIFELTRDIGYWSVSNIKHDYNACLSLSILPAVISNLTGMSGVLVFKVLYQILFAIVPLSIFLQSRRYVSSIIGFFTAIYFISQPFFIQPMTALMRQEIAFLFFAILILAIFEKHIGEKTRIILFTLFGMSMVVSHYSTTYIALILLFISYGVLFIYRKIENIKTVASLLIKLGLKSSRNYFRFHYFISPIFVLLLFIFSFIWYALINNNAKHVLEVSETVAKNIKNTFNSEIKNKDVTTATDIFGSDQAYSLKYIQIYTEEQIKQFANDKNDRYPSDTYKYLALYPILPQEVSSLIFKPISDHISIGLTVLKQLTKLFVIGGLLMLVIKRFKTAKYNREFIILGIAVELLIIAMLIHPTLAGDYNLSRLYLQSLVVLSLPAVLGGLLFFSFFKKYALHATGLSLIILFLHLSGFTSQIFGGTALMHLNNYGSDYDKFYVHSTEVASGQWLAKHKNGFLVFGDSHANLRLRQTSWINTNPTVLPQVLYKYSYVYASTTNIKENSTSTYYSGIELQYSFPSEFLEENKNVIYNNGGSKIYQ